MRTCCPEAVAANGTGETVRRKRTPGRFRRTNSIRARMSDQDLCEPEVHELVLLWGELATLGAGTHRIGCTVDA